MKRHPHVIRRHARTYSIFGLGAACVVLGLSACGSGASASSDDEVTAEDARAVDAAEESLAAHMDTADPVPVGEPFDASRANGMTIGVVESAGANPAVAQVSRVVHDAVERHGVSVRRCDAENASVQMGSCIDRVVAQGAEAVVVIGGDPETYSSGVQNARKQGVPVTSALALPLPSAVEEAGVDAADLRELTDIVDAVVAPPAGLSGVLAADFIVADSDADATILYIASPGIVQGHYEEAAFEQRISETCPSCEVISEGVAAPSWASDLAPLVQAQLAKNPDITHVVPAFDPMAAYTNPAIRQANKADSVKVVTVNGSFQQMQELADDGVMAANIGQNLAEMGYMAADQALRYLTGSTDVADAVASVRVFTKENIDTLDVNDDEAYQTGEWYTGAADALDETYDALWSAGS